MAAGDGSRRRRARQHRDRRRERQRRRPRDRRDRARAGAAPAGRQVPRLRMVEPAVASRGARPGRRRARPRPGTPAGRASSRPSAPISTTFWDRADVELEGDVELQQAVRFAPLPHAPGRRARRAARDRREGAHRPRLRRPHVLGHGAIRATGAHLHRARRCRRRAALAARHARSRPRARDAARLRAVPRSPGARSAARSAPATGPQAPPPSTSTPTSPTPSSATRRPPRTTNSNRRSGLELLVETARLWRSLGHHDAQGRFRIDGVTGPDEYSAIADNNVYTNLLAAAESPRRSRRRRATPAARRRLRSRARGGSELA